MKKKTIRNVIASILVLVMTMALFAGCELAPTESKPAETDPPKVEALNYNLYYHANPAAVYKIDKDETVHVTLYNKGMSVSARVKDFEVAAEIRHEIVGVLEKDDKGIITGFKGVEEIGASYACKFAYITEVNADYTDVTVNGDTKIKLTSKTIKTDTTGKTSVGNNVKLRVGDCITAVADSNGDITHVFKVSAVTATKSANCEHCGKKVTWTAYYGDNNSLPTATGHYYLVDDMMGKATTIEKNATVCFDLNGHTVTFSGNQRLVSMNNGGNKFALMDTSEGKTGTIKYAKGDAAVNGGIVWANKGSFYMYGGTLDASEMTNNGFGCAVYVGTAGSKVTFKMTAGTIIGGSSVYDPAGTGGNGGAIYITGAADTTATIEGGEIKAGKAVDNTTGTPRGKGGAIYVASDTTLTINGGTVTAGEASDANGAGIWAAETAVLKIADAAKIDKVFQVQPAVPETPAEPAA